MSNELRKAFYIWRHLRGHHEIDQKVEPLLSDFIDTKHRKWLRDSREALFLSMADVAKRMGISKQSYAKLERREARGRISLEALMRAAQAMDCELVYGIRPQERGPFSGRLWIHALGPAALKIYRQRIRSSKIKPLILAKIAQNLMIRPAFRRENAWARNRKPRRKSL